MSDVAQVRAKAKSELSVYSICSLQSHELADHRFEQCPIGLRYFLHKMAFALLNFRRASWPYLKGGYKGAQSKLGL